MPETEVTLRWSISSADEPLYLSIINVVKLDSLRLQTDRDPLMSCVVNPDIFFYGRDDRRVSQSHAVKARQRKQNGAHKLQGASSVIIKLYFPPLPRASFYFMAAHRRAARLLSEPC